MRIIGITGGVGAGKSRVLDFLQEHYGASVYKADEVAKNLQKKGTACYDDIVAEFGREILDPEEELDRNKLAEIIFSDPQKLQRLNQIVHPAVREYLLSHIEEERKKQTQYMIIEAALLLEEGYDEICNEIWYIYASEEVRKERLMCSRGYGEEKVAQIMASQLSEDVFRSRCSASVENNRDFEDTMRQIGELLE